MDCSRQGWIAIYSLPPELIKFRTESVSPALSSVFFRLGDPSASDLLLEARFEPSPLLFPPLLLLLLDMLSEVASGSDVFFLAAFDGPDDVLGEKKLVRERCCAVPGILVASADVKQKKFQ